MKSYHDEDAFANYEDWIQFCKAGSSEYEPCDFYILLMEEREPERLKAILKPFPNSEELYIRLAYYLGIETPEWGKNEMTPQSALSLARQDFEYKVKAYEDRSSRKFSISLMDLETDITKNSNAFNTRKKNSKIQIDFIQGVNDFIIDNDKLGSRLSYALSEMYYGLTNSFEHSWYLKEPLINTQYSFSHYFKLTYFGYNYFIEGSSLILLDPNN